MAKPRPLRITITEADGGQGGTVMDAVIATEDVAAVGPRLPVANAQGIQQHPIRVRQEDEAALESLREPLRNLGRVDAHREERNTAL